MDFEYNGYMFSMPGDGVMLLSDLLEELHINADVADVENVTFTDGNLLSVVKMQQATTYYALYMARYGVDGSEDEATVEGSNKYVDQPIAAGDWVIASLNPFETVEELTVLLSDGTEYAIAVTDPQGDGGVWTLIKGETATSIDAAVSTSIQETDQERNVSFRATMSYEVTSGTLTAMKNYHGGFPTLVYDLTDWVNSAPATISNSSGAIKDKNEQVGEYEIRDGKVYLTFNNLLWLQQQDSLKGTFKLTINVDETKVGADDEWHLDLPGTSSDVKVPFKKVDFNTSKTVSFDGTKEDGKGAFVTKGEDGYYYLNYTATFKTPVDLKNLTFKDTLSGGQELTGDVTITDPNGTTTTVSITKPGVDETTFSFAVPQNMNEAENPNKVKAGTYTVNYQTRVSEEYVKYYNASDVATQANDAAWKVEGKKDDVPGGHTEEKIVKEPPTPGEEKVTKTVDKTSAQPGDILHYEVTFGEGENPSQNKAATDLSEAVISDYMTDTQKLTGNIQISYDGGTTWQNMPAAGSDWAGGVVWNNDNQYSANNTDLFRFKLPKGTTGPVKVKYDTQVISKDEAIASNLWGTTMADNYAKVNNTTEWTHTTVTMPEEPTIEKTVNGKTGDTGETWQYDQVVEYVLTYGSPDVKLAGTTIYDSMNRLQNLVGDVEIYFSDGTKFGNMPDYADNGVGGVNWPRTGFTYEAWGSQSLFNYTFTQENVGDRKGPVTIKYKAKVLSKTDAERLNLFGLQDVTNLFMNNVQTIGHVDTQKPVDVDKVVKDADNNVVISEADPEGVVTYTVTYGKPGENLSNVTLYDQMTDIQTLQGDITVNLPDGTQVTIGSSDTAHYKWQNDTNYSTNLVDVFEYTVGTVPDGVITVTYKAKMLPKETLNNLGYFGEQHVKNHATTNKGGNGDTDIVVKYGDKPEPHVDKTGVVNGKVSGEWAPGDKIKWTVVFGDSVTDMRGKVLEDYMLFLQKLDEVYGVDITIGGTTSKMPVATDRWNGNGVLYRTDDNVNQDKYGPWTEAPVFKYTVPGGDDPVFGPITVVYYTTILTQEEAWTHDITGKINLYNNAGYDGKWVKPQEPVDFDNPPDPTPKKTATTGTALDGMVEHENGTAYKLGDYITYTISFGNQYTSLDNAWIDDFMTEIQDLVGNVEMKIRDGAWTAMPTAADSNTGVGDGVKWNLLHTAGTYSTQQKCVFAYKFGDDAGVGPVQIRYTVKLMSNEDALRNGLVNAINDTNTFKVNSTQVSHYGPVTPDVPGPDPKKTVANTLGHESTAWQPEDELTYTLTYGYEGQWINNPEALTLIYDQMTNLQKLDTVTGVNITYYTDYERTNQASFTMPAATTDNNNNGVRWVNGTSFSIDMKDVFSYTFPKPDEKKPGTNEDMGRVYGPITVTYKTTIISAQEALDSRVWGDKDVNNNFLNVATTTGTVPFPSEPVHKGDIFKTGKRDKTTGEAAFDTVIKTVDEANSNEWYTSYNTNVIPAENAENNIVRDEKTVYWTIKVDAEKASGSSFPLTNVYVSDTYYSAQINGVHSGGAPSDVIDFTKAVIKTESGTVLSPGVDYTARVGDGTGGSYNTLGAIYWHFDVINEPIYITVPAVYKTEFAGYVKFTNTVYLNLVDVNQQTNAEASIEETYTNIGVNKEGHYTEGSDIIEWTVTLNPAKQTIANDMTKVIFKDTLPEGLELVKWSSEDDYYVAVYGLGDTCWWGVNGAEPEKFGSDSVQIDGNTFSVDITPYKWEQNYAEYGDYDQHKTNVAEVGVSKQKYEIHYKTRIKNWAEITSSETGSKTYENKALFYDDTHSYAGTGTETVYAEKPMNKFELADNHNQPGEKMEPEVDLDTQYYWYEIDINKNREQLTKEIDGSLQVLKITDYIDPKIDIVQSNVKLYRVEENDSRTDTSTLTGTDKPTIQYNDDTRMLVVDNLQDKTAYVLQYQVRVRAVWTDGMDESEYTITNTVNLEGNKKWSDSTTGKHKIQTEGATAEGSINMLKVDENDITKLLEGAQIEIYEQPTNVTNIVSTYDNSTKKVTVTYEGDGKFNSVPLQQGTTFTSDAEGKITLTGISSFRANTLYYWIETKAPDVPEGEDPYIENTEPHYFVIYAPGVDEDGTDTAINRETAWALDNLWTEANDITVASMSSDTEWIINNSRLRSIAITKAWQEDYNNLYKTRPDSITVNLIQIDWQGNRNVLKSTKLMPNEEGKWDDYTNYIWTGLPVAEPGHPDHLYTYTVEEENCPGYFAVYSDDQKGIKSGKIEITNRLIPSKTDIVIEKKWEGVEASALPEAIDVTLMQILKDEDGNVGKPLPATSIPGYAVTLHKDPETNRWTYEWKDLPTKDGEGGTYSYTVRETVPAGYKVTYSDDNRGVLESTEKDPLVITNTATTEYHVFKKWMSNGTVWNPKYNGGEIKFRLYKQSTTDASQRTQVVPATAGGYETLQVTDTVWMSAADLGIKAENNEGDQKIIVDNLTPETKNGVKGYNIPYMKVFTLPKMSGNWEYVAVELTSDGREELKDSQRNSGTGEFWTCAEFNGMAIKNNLQDVTARKNWVAGDYYHPAITLDLYRTTDAIPADSWSNDTGYDSVAGINWGEPIGTQTIPAETTGDALNVTWSDMPKYDLATGKKYTYYVKERSGLGYALKSRGLDGGNEYIFTLENERQGKTVEVTKAWRNASGTVIDAWQAEITLTLSRYLKPSSGDIQQDNAFTKTVRLNLPSGTQPGATTTADGLTVTYVKDTNGFFNFTIGNLDAVGKLNDVSGEWMYMLTETDSAGRLVGYGRADANAPDASIQSIGEGDDDGKIIFNTEPGVALPATGGSGTTLFYVLGSALTLLAIVLLITRKRTDGEGIE